jgi:hypothetical protein
VSGYLQQAGHRGSGVFLFERSASRSPGKSRSALASRPIAWRMLFMSARQNCHRPASAASSAAMVSASKPTCPNSRAVAIWSRRSLIAWLRDNVASGDRFQLGNRRGGVGEGVQLPGHNMFSRDGQLDAAASLGDGAVVALQAADGVRKVSIAPSPSSRMKCLFHKGATGGAAAHP